MAKHGGLTRPAKSLEEIHAFNQQVFQLLHGLDLSNIGKLLTEEGGETGDLVLQKGRAFSMQLTDSPNGLPDANTAYRESIAKAWIRFNMATDAIADSFNVSSITAGAVSSDTVVWDRDFANANYSIGHSHAHQFGVTRNVSLSIDSIAAGSVLVTMNPAYDETVLSLQAFGDQ